MATPNYTEEEILFRRRARRRLVGAIVLVVTVIAIVPMILPESKPQQETQQIEIRIPAQDASGYATKITPAPTPSVTTTESVPAPPSGTPSPIDTKKLEVKPADIASPVKSVAAEKPKDTSATPKPVHQATEPAHSSGVVKQTYFVQYGAFSEQKNAKQRQTDLKAKGINSFTEVVKTTAGDKIRVRSGPYAAREEAEKIRVKVQPLDSKLVVMGDNH